MKERVTAYTTPARIASVLLLTASRGILLVMLALLLFSETNLDNPLRLISVFAAFSFLPGAAAWLLERAFTATTWFEDGMLVIDQRRRRVDIPCGAVDAVMPWKLPLPSSGLWLRMRSGQRLSYGVTPADPPAFVKRLVAEGAPEHLLTATTDSGFLYTSLKNAVPRPWYLPIFKFVAFALVPTLPLFRLHQWIAYGGTFGEYYTYGLEAYLLGFGIYWATVVIYLLMYAGVLRAVGEAVSLAAAYAAPSQAARARRLTELVHGWLYYAGVPALVIWYMVRR